MNRKTTTTASTTRRIFLGGLGAGLGLGAAAWLSPEALADELARTPRQTEGPFYPDELPLDTDNDLIRIGDAGASALGEVTHLRGRVLDPSGEPIRNATVEIWQVDNNGVYIHSADRRKDLRDTNFQGYGRFETASDGRYHFRTIKPVPYPGRTPHIHVAVSLNGHRILTTQLYIAGHPMNERDGIFRRIGDADAKASVLVPFEPVPDSKVGELAANFPIVTGRTAEEGEDGGMRPAARRRSGRQR